MALVIMSGCGAASKPDESPPPRLHEQDGQPRAASPVAGIAHVRINNFSYQPQTVTILPGTSVVWTNNDSINHTVTSGSPTKPFGMFAGEVAPGGMFSFQFDVVGTYPYYCDHHPTMVGQVIVTLP